jgi:hypothetical protein
LNEFKLVLEDTDYGSYFNLDQDLANMEIVVLKKKMKDKLMSEIQFMIA